MKPIQIKEILTMAWNANRNGKKVNPLFKGDSGLGKSAIILEWCKEMAEKEGDFHFIDLRLAYLERVDFLGFPIVTVNKEGKQVTRYATPDIFPTIGKGLLILEEVNRADDSSSNCLMELLQEGRVGTYPFPKEWIICSSNNDDIQGMAVNSMDTALLNRFVPFKIDYDHASFLSYIKSQGYHDSIIQFIEGGKWVYVPSDKIPADRKYISPRNWEQLNAALSTNLDANPSLHLDVAMAILGQFYGKSFHDFRFNDSPVVVSDILSNRKTAIAKLKKQSKNKTSYHGDMISVTCNDLVNKFNGEIEDDAEKVGEKTIAEIISIIPKDLGINLLYNIASNQMQTSDKFKDVELGKRHVAVMNYWKTTYAEYLKDLHIKKDS